MPRMSPTVHSTMGCVDGVIKFLSMDGYDNNDWPKDRINITSWTLQEKWRKVDDSDLLVANLWADSTFAAIPGLQQLVPMCPVLSLKEPNMVSFFSDIGYVDDHVATKGEYVLSLNMKSKMIRSWSRCPPGRSLEFIPRVIATDFCAHQQWSCMDYRVIYSATITHHLAAYEPYGFMFDYYGTGQWTLLTPKIIFLPYGRSDIFNSCGSKICI